MRLAAVPPIVAPWRRGAPFGALQLFLTDSRLVLTVLNHLPYQALNRVFGTSREQANALTAVLLLGAADSAYESARRIGGLRLRVSRRGSRRDRAARSGARRAGRPIFGALVAFALLGGLAAPGLRRMAQRMPVAERRVRRERIRRYAAARDRLWANAA